MKKIILLAFPGVVLLGVVLMVTRLEAKRAPDWKVVLDEYIAQSMLPEETIEIQAAVQASMPERFTVAMGSPVRQDWPWGIEEIPYPPTAVWCRCRCPRARRPGQCDRRLLSAQSRSCPLHTTPTTIVQLTRMSGVGYNPAMRYIPRE